MPNRRIYKVKERWKNLRGTSGFKNSMLFLVFIFVATIFWFILALNDSAQDHFNVNLRIINQPDSVTFISDVPEKFHVTVSDKGTTLWRNGYLKKPTINIDFKEYSSDGILRYSYNDLITSLRTAFGGGAVITSVSLDSLQLFYTTNPGKRVPVEINCKVIPAPGTTMEGRITADPAFVHVYGEKSYRDTVHYVMTENLTLRDLSENTVMEVKLNKLRNVRSIPSKVTINIPIEPLVMKEAMVTVDAVDVPPGEELLLFPSKVPVEYYVAMSRLNDDEDSNITLKVNYEDVEVSKNGKLRVMVVDYPERLKNLQLRTDSVEFAVIKD